MTDEMARAMQADAEAVAAHADEVAATPGAAIAVNVEMALLLQQEIATIEAALEQTKERLTDLVRRRIPAALDAVGVPALTVIVGNRQVRVAIENKPYGSLNYAPDPEAAIDILEAAGLDGGVITRAAIDLKSDERHLLTDINAALGTFGKTINVSRDIYHSTLRAFVKNQLEEHPGSLDPAAVGVTLVREAKLTVIDK
jgi:hypothetical protein